MAGNVSECDQSHGIRLTNRHEQAKPTKQMAEMSDGGAMEDDGTTRRHVAQLSTQDVVVRTMGGGKKRKSTEAFDGEQGEELSRRPHRIEREKIACTLVCPDSTNEANTMGWTAGHTIRSISPAGKRVRLNLPRLMIPELIPKKDEEAMLDLHVLLKAHGFEVYDRPTLAFFAIGAKHDIQAALLFFQEFYKLAQTQEIRFPDHMRMAQMEADGFLEGFARHHDGTYGGLLNPGRWNVENNQALNVVRELLCYHLHIVDFSLLKNGATVVANLRQLSWRRTAPFEMAKVVNLMYKSIPVGINKFLLLEPNFYAQVALNLSSLVASSVVSVSHIVSLEEAREACPDIILPPSLTPITKESDRFTKLSTDEQINFQILID